jgi:16S rRNA (cytosine967-C5)-methyltransferase
VITARRAAYDALTAVTKDGAYTSLALKGHIPAELSPGDKAFASLLVRTTLENLLLIDHILEQFIRSGRVHGSVKNILRLGACQIILLDTEGYAAVSECVDLAKQIKPQTSGFVNGVLRSLIRGKDNIEYPSGESAGSLSILTSYPLWICEKYINDFGYDFTNSLLSFKNRKGTCVRINTLRADPKAFLKEAGRLGLDYSPGNIENSYNIKGLSGIEDLDIYKNGSIAVQSESSMKAVLKTKINKGMKLLDCCAAPGGKSAYAAALAKNTIDIIAWDVHKHRIDMTKKNYERLGVENYNCSVHDARVFEPNMERAFDVVIVDAPCSAMGLMSKSPDIRYSRKPKDIDALTKTQHDIISVCSEYVRPEGTLAYCTCSINKEENEQITEQFLAENNEFKYAYEPETLYPHLCGSDGFYTAVMKRKV